MGISLDSPQELQKGAASLRRASNEKMRALKAKLKSALTEIQDQKESQALLQEGYDALKEEYQLTLETKESEHRKISQEVEAWVL